MIETTPQAPDDEGALVARVRQGDREAFVQLMRRYNQRVFRIARAILPDDAEAEDAAQEAWVLAWRHLQQLASDASFGGWLGRIVSREATARARRHRLVLVDTVEDSPMVDSPDPERGTQRAEARALIERAVDTLPEAFRAVFVLRSVEELSIAETADYLDIPEETVKTRLHRARRLLQEQLARELDAASRDVFSFASERCDRITERVLKRLD